MTRMFGLLDISETRKSGTALRQAVVVACVLGEALLLKYMIATVGFAACAVADSRAAEGQQCARGPTGRYGCESDHVSPPIRAITPSASFPRPPPAPPAGAPRRATSARQLSTHRSTSSSVRSGRWWKSTSCSTSGIERQLDGILVRRVSPPTNAVDTRSAVYIVSCTSTARAAHELDEPLAPVAARRRTAPPDSARCPRHRRAPARRRYRR